MFESTLFEWVYVAEAFEYWLLALSVRLGGYQPHYFPRLHCLARMLDSDISPIADYVQYVRKHAYPTHDGRRVNGPSYQAHTPIKTRNGTLLLGVPVTHAGHFQRLNEAQVSYAASWQDDHCNIIREAYRAAPFFNQVFPEVESIVRRTYPSLASLTIATTTWSLAYLLEMPQRTEAKMQNIAEALRRSSFRLRTIIPISETSVPPPYKESGRDANDWIIDMCRHFGADEYYFGGTSAACYMDFSRYQAANIALKQQSWTCAPYPQLHGEFVPNLSILDLLMNVSPGDARTHLHT